MSRVLPLLLLLASPAAAVPPPSFDDAPLRAVQFVDAKVGWAVGDHGAVWNTIDGGKTWERQRTGTKASLRAVRFLTPYTGWAAGRVELPHDAGSQGVLLFTDDGGLSWQEMASPPLPGLNAVRFFDEQRGVVAGDGTDAFPTGVFSTADGGKTWTPVSGPRATSWLAADFTAPGSGLVGGAWGRLMRVRDGALSPVELDPLGNRTVRGIVSDGSRSVAVADGGRILVSSTGGAKWGFANFPMPESAAASCDLRCVAAAGNHVWAAGRPGSVVFHSPDFGRTWETQRTNHPVPVNALFMLDAQTGWAVGDLGTILGTTDGGKSWAVLKCGGQRAGVLFAHAKADRVPLGVVARVGGADGYLTAALALTSADPATADPKRAADEFRLISAVRSVGGAVAEGFHTDTDTGTDTFLRRLVLAIRTWRPEVIAADPFPATDPTEKAVLAAVQEAFKQAADPAAFPEQVEHLGLAPHAAKKLYAMTADAPDAVVRYDLSEFNDPLRDTPRDAAEPAASLIPGAHAADRQAFRLLSHRLPGSEQHAALTDGVDLAEGGAGRRERPEANPALATLLVDRAKAARTRVQLEALAKSPEAGAGADKTLAHVAGMVVQMPDDMAAKAAVGLGRQFAADGKWTAAREMFALVADRYPAHQEAAEALRWLARYYASSEVRRRLELGQQVIFQQAAFAPASATADGKPSHLEPATAKQVFRFSSPEAAKRWSEAAIELEPKLAAFGAGYARDPGTNLSLLAARRQLGLYGDVSTMTTALVRSAGGLTAGPGADPWRDCLAAELWLGNPKSVPLPPKPAAQATYAPVKPLLDGKLDDACWKNAPAIGFEDRGTPSAKAYPTRAMLAFDEKFLYLAVRCGHPEGKAVPKATKRGYDADLSGHDRVELLLDLDRDYQTYYRLRVDHRGMVAEDCWGDVKWNPRWFVAVEPSADGWTAEVAIPLSELTGTAPTTGVVWAGNVVRVIPGVGVQSWSGPADAAPRPEGMGLIRFHAEAK